MIKESREKNRLLIADDSKMNREILKDVYKRQGLVNGPFCVLYGITAVIITVGLQELTGIWLFLFAMIYATVVAVSYTHLPL